MGSSGGGIPIVSDIFSTVGSLFAPDIPDVPEVEAPPEVDSEEAMQESIDEQRKRIIASQESGRASTILTGLEEQEDEEVAQATLLGG